MMKNLSIYLFTIACLHKNIKAPVIETLDCNFDTNYCGWAHDTSDDFDWKRDSGSSYSYGGPKSDHTTGDGQYIFIKKTWEAESGNSKLISPITSSGQYCLTFWYSMYGSVYGRYIGAPKVFVYIMRDKYKTLIFKSDDYIDNRDWWKSALNIDSKESFKIVLEGNIRQHLYGYIAIDDISIKPGPCSADCDFDVDFCNWAQYYGDKFDWTRQKGKTNTPNTGPTFDHTTKAGHYIYIESSYRYKQDTAIILSPYLDAGKYCVSYWYYMYGSDIDRLQLQSWHTNGSKVTLRSIESEQGQRWFHDMLTVSSRDSFQIAFEGRVQGTYYTSRGDIAIDDVTLFTCKDCYDPTPNHGLANATNYEYGAVVKIQCNHGYILIGDSVIVCESMERWNGTATCIPYDCGNLTIPNGTFITLNGTTFGEVGRQGCDTGFVLIGEPSIRCTANGWFNTTAYCKLVEKENLEPSNTFLVALYFSTPVIVIIIAVLVSVVYIRRRHPNCMNIFKTVHGSTNTPTEASLNGKSHSNQMYSNGAVELDDEYATIAEEQNKNDGLDSVYYAKVKKKITKDSDRKHTLEVNKSSSSGKKDHTGFSTEDLNSRIGNNEDQYADYDHALTRTMNNKTLTCDEYSHIGYFETEYQNTFHEQTDMQENTDYSHIDTANTIPRFPRHL